MRPCAMVVHQLVEQAAQKLVEWRRSRLPIMLGMVIFGIQGGETGQK
jgi:hypothetical protein